MTAKKHETKKPRHPDNELDPPFDIQPKMDVTAELEKLREAIKQFRDEVNKALAHIGVNIKTEI